MLISMSKGVIAILFTAVLLGQLAGITLLPRTQGFSNVTFTLASLAMFALSYAAMARLIAGGVELGILIPALSVIVPLATVAIGVMIYHESASLPKIGFLVVACCLVGVASRY